MKPGTKVRINEQYVKRLKAFKIKNQIHHLDKYIGVVLGPVDWGRGQIGPEVDVRWQPLGLKFCYDPAELSIVEEA